MLSFVIADCPVRSRVWVLRSTLRMESMKGILKCRPVSTTLTIRPRRITATFSHCLTMYKAETKAMTKTTKNTVKDIAQKKLWAESPVHNSISLSPPLLFCLPVLIHSQMAVAYPQERRIPEWCEHTSYLGYEPFHFLPCSFYSVLNEGYRGFPSNVGLFPIRLR